MELQAVIAGLAALKESSVVTVVTDSQYIQRGMTQFLPKWITRGWTGSRGVPVSNRDLWETLLRASSRHEVTWTWIRGHGASAEQNRCDELAQTAARSVAIAM
jgi:ribonuclease HI